MKTREEIEGSRVTIDVALLRELAAWPNTSLVAYGPVVLLKPTTVTELLDAYEERDRLRVMLKEIGNQAANINHHCYQTGKLQCVACASSQELIEELARAALEGRE